MISPLQSFDLIPCSLQKQYLKVREFFSFLQGSMSHSNPRRTTAVAYFLLHFPHKLSKNKEPKTEGAARVLDTSKQTGEKEEEKIDTSNIIGSVFSQWNVCKCQWGKKREFHVMTRRLLRCLLCMLNPFSLFPLTQIRQEWWGAVIPFLH